MTLEEAANLPPDESIKFQDAIARWQNRYRISIILANAIVVVIFGAILIPQGGFLPYLAALAFLYVGFHIIFPIWLHNVYIRVLYGIAYILPFLRKMAPLEATSRYALPDEESGFSPYELRDIQTTNAYLFLRLPKVPLFHIGAYCILVLIPGFIWFLPVHFFPPTTFLEELRADGDFKLAQLLPYIGFLAGTFHFIYEYLIHPFLYPFYWRTGDNIIEYLEMRTGQKKELDRPERTSGIPSGDAQD